MSFITRILTAGLGLFLVSAGISKFTGGHVFAYIEYQSGFDLFDPYVAALTGVAEIVAGSLLLFRRTRLLGATLGGIVMAGAVAFHLSPWLGVAPPTGFAEGAASPWTAADFGGDTSVAPFVLATISLVSCGAIARSARRRGIDSESGGVGGVVDAAPADAATV